MDAIDAGCLRASPRSRDDARREDARREIENDPSGLGCRSSAGWDVPPRARGWRREPSSGPWRRICCSARSKGGGRRGQSRGRARVRGRYPGGRSIATSAALAHRSLQISRTNAFASGKRSRGRDRGRTRRPRRGRRAGERRRRKRPLLLRLGCSDWCGSCASMSAMGTQTRPLPESQREKQYPLDQSEAISRSRAGDPPAREQF